MFRLSETPIDRGRAQARALRRRASAGALRDLRRLGAGPQRAGAPVSALDYEAYEPLAVKEGERILAEARARFPVLDAACAHRVGALALGDLAVWVGVTAEHRGAAFDACRYIIDQTKARVPIRSASTMPAGRALRADCAAPPSPLLAHRGHGNSVGAKVDELGQVLGASAGFL